jgi:hypothetical protein
MADSILIAEGRPLTREDLERAADLIRQNYGRVEPELHHPKCPKYLTQGKKACRCGACPEEAAFEDELENPSRR